MGLQNIKARSCSQDASRLVLMLWWKQYKARACEGKKHKKPLQIKAQLRRCRACGAPIMISGKYCPRCKQTTGTKKGRVNNDN